MDREELVNIATRLGHHVGIIKVARAAFLRGIDRQKMIDLIHASFPGADQHEAEAAAEVAAQDPLATIVIDDDLEEHMRRLDRPDGYCLQCQQPANQYHPVGPITITITEPDDCGDTRTHEFCEWRCFAQWVAVAAGGAFVIEQAVKENHGQSPDTPIAPMQ
jgi:hypothetical protein